MFDRLTKTVLPEKSHGILKRSGTVYYLGTLFFIAGIILIVLGVISVMFFQVHYESESGIVLPIVIYIGIGLMLIALGINFMIFQSKKGYIISLVGWILSVISIVIFLLNFESNWYYPTINYILVFYISGLILLMGNAFGNATLRLINPDVTRGGMKAEKITHEYTDEEIERDIDEAVKKSLFKAADEIEFDYVDTKKINIANMASDSESVVKVHDPMDESFKLNQTMNPGDREEWGGMGVDKVSMKLAEALEEPSYHKRSWFEIIKSFFSK